MNFTDVDAEPAQITPNTLDPPGGSSWRGKGRIW